ncbi:biopolymer transporter ExbD [Olivibacter sp. SDN3]|uniref:ExbD/TolR family protein n=1 Tax=Olivibacter sp. SDN3 TaxID=2764720 RepID=UPI0016516665|nr:biopolymer transporter ExbD [Olivibacter sp. SDN3]QNL51375.1 biopolymer transporter ExbD [Olivibacter sp. SDN3]
MAELNTGGKQQPRVDLTAMVDLAFLLITFFMLTTSLAKPHAMDVAMPDKDKENKDDNLEVADNRSMTVLLGANNKIAYYMGQLENPIDGPTVVDYGKNGIRPVLLEKLKSVQAATGKGLIVIIRPAETSNYRNLVDILDEMKIVNATQYTIGDIGEAEVELLKEQGIN